MLGVGRDLKDRLVPWAGMLFTRQLDWVAQGVAEHGLEHWHTCILASSSFHKLCTSSSPLLPPSVTYYFHHGTTQYHGALQKPCSYLGCGWVYTFSSHFHVSLELDKEWGFSPSGFALMGCRPSWDSPADSRRLGTRMHGLGVEPARFQAALLALWVRWAWMEVARHHSRLDAMASSLEASSPYRILVTL